MAAVAPVGQGFTVTASDLAFILKQIKISERHAATLTAANPCGTLVGPGPDQIPDRLTSYGLRTVDGSCNNLFPGRENFAAADQVFPRLTTPLFRDAEANPPLFGPPAPSSYKQKTGNVFDSQPRIISNLIVDQTSTNPAAVQAAGFPVRTQGNPGLFPCTTDPNPLATPPVVGVPANCVPSHHTLFIPNVTTDVGLSPPYNSVFTFFGQFFDHGVDQTVKGGGTVFVPLRSDDPLVTLGPDGKPNTGDEVPPNRAFMVLTRAQNQPGPDGILGTADDIQEATNTDSPWVDQSQTYTSHSSHQVFLRQYVLNSAGKPVSTGKLLGGLPGNGASGMATWASVKAQAASLLGLKLVDVDVSNVPMLATDPYGKFIPGPNGLPQYVTKTGLVEGNLASPVPVPANVLHFDTPFLTDIAHNADPGTVGPCTTAIGVTPRSPVGCLSPDLDTVASANFAAQPPGTYDDEMLDAHFCAGDGRVNENIALSAIHQVFHSEHDRLVDYIKGVLTNDTSATGVAALPQWQLASGAAGWNGERLFQAARFVTEMEYQHLVFEEFARKVQPAVRPFHVYSPDIQPAVPAEFAHAVFRFGHSMLDDTVARTNVDPVSGAKSDNSIPLLNAFLNPPEFFNGGTAGLLTPERAAGSIFMGSSSQVGNELDEFVTETLRNNLLGLPLDLPTLNLTRAREAGVPPLNDVRRQIFAKTNDGQLKPYTSWSDFGQHLKHPLTLINFVAAYGTHPSITSATTLDAKRAAAKAIVDPAVPADAPADAAAFMFSTGVWANNASGRSTTGLDDVDLWIGGLSEVTNLFGGLLGSTFNYVFQSTLENLQDGDRFYYIFRTTGLNLRAQLEGNSFAELIQRNTDGTNSLKADPFATADCRFQLANLAGTPAGFTQFGSSVADDLTTTDCNENLLLLRKPDGTIQYRQFNTVNPSGINGQSVYNGTPGVDRIFGGNDNDTFWGGAGNDIIEGNGGADVTLGGDGNDTITDLGGDDVQKGGPGNDAIDGGIGNDIILGGDGSDFTNGGANDNETFGGPGNDFIIGGQGADAVFGDGGDDWIQGGSGQDLLQGDHGAPFFDDPGQAKPGNDVFIGQVGENDYDTEGGDDIMSQNAAIDRNAGSAGFDWAIHQYDTVGADDDMAINNNLLGLPLPVVVNRDRWQETEADSGSPFNDVIKGDSVVPSAVGGAGFTGCDVLDQAGVDRIKGLAAILPPLAGDSSTVAAISMTGFCPLIGPFWGAGNILLGGAGSDTIEGRGGNDIIDGDRELTVRISVRTNPADPATEIGSTDLMEHQYLRDASGALTGPTLQAAVFDGTVDPGNLVIVREIVSHPGTLDVDTAVFSGPRGAYDITTVGTTVTVAHVRGGATDGTDTLRNIERLQFSDVTLNVTNGVVAAPVASLSAASATFTARAFGTASAPKTVTLTNTGTAPLTPTFALAGTNPGSFQIASNTCGASVAAGASCTIGIAFAPAAPAGAKTAILRITDNAAGSPHDVALSGTALVPNLVLALGMDEGTGTTAADSSGAGNNGVLGANTAGGAIPTWAAAGRFGSALSFNGSSSWLTVPDASSLGLTTGMTLEAWVKPAALGTAWRTVFFKEQPGGMVYSLYANETSGMPLAQVNVGGEKNALGTASLAPNAWAHLASTYDGTTLRLYVNGTLVTSLAVGGPIPISAGPLRLGGNSIWSEWFNGLIDEVRVYDRALTAAEITTDMNTPVVAGAASTDTTPPTVSMTAPAAGAVSGNAVTVSADAADNIGVAGVQFRLDGANLNAEVTTAPYRISWNSTAVANGSHTLTAIARDAAGNTTTATAVTVTVSNTAPAPAPPPPAAPAGLVAAYGFNEGTGTTTADASGRGNSGTLSGASWTTAGKFGGALSFNGVNNWVTVNGSPSLDLTNGMTLEAWVNPSALGTQWRTAIIKEQAAGLVYALYADATDTLQPSGHVNIGGDVWTRGTGRIPLNAWTHLAVTYDGAELRMYVNGTLASTKPVVGSMTASTGPLRFGGNSVWSEWFQGSLDEIRVYNRALNATEVQSDMGRAVG